MSTLTYVIVIVGDNFSFVAGMMKSEENGAKDVVISYGDNHVCISQTETDTDEWY